MKYHTSHKSILGLLIALLVAVSASAQNSTVTFDLSELTNNSASDDMTGSDGTKLTVSNSNSSGSGIDLSTSILGGLYVYQGTDGNTLSFSFDKDVRLEAYTTGNTVIGVFEIADSLTLQVGISNPVTESLVAVAASSTYEFNNKLIIPQNTILTIRTNNPPDSTALLAGWKTLTVTTTVPEPSTYALFLGFGAFVFIMIRHRSHD